MALPRRFSWTITEAAARWGCMPADIIDWALLGHLRVAAAFHTITTDRGDAAGILVVPPEDLVRMFRRDGSGPRTTTVRRVARPGRDQEWMRITEPNEGVQLEAPDLIVTHEEMDQFEETHELTPKPRHYPPGATARWDWEGFYTALIRRIHDHGLPDQQKDLVNEMQEWFERRSETGEAPDISTIRKKIAAVWRELREAS